MNSKKMSIVMLGISVLLVVVLSGLGYSGVKAAKTAVPMINNGTSSCHPFYGTQEYLLRVNDSSLYDYEPFLTPVEINGDGLEDVLITKATFLSYETYELDILLNDGQGGLKLATSDLFSGAVPAVQNPTEVVTADFNGDGRTDIFVADHGYDNWPFPGFQNQLALSTTSGRLVDATSNLPQQYDFTHSACAADIDNDDDVDLYIGNIWGESEINPLILLNDGQGKFTEGQNRLPLLTDLSQNGFTTCAFTDVNNDDAPDLVLADAGDLIENAYSTPTSEVLLNNGAGVFSHLPNAMPPKAVSVHDIGHAIEPLYLNGDVYIDLVVVYEGWKGVDGQTWDGSYIQTLINNKDGTFRDETDTRMESLDYKVGIPRLTVRDLNRDGALDLLASTWDVNNPDPILFVNDSQGWFSREPMIFGLTYLYYAFLDFDGDNGHDLVMATYAPPEDIFAIRDLGCPAFLPFIRGN